MSTLTAMKPIKLTFFSNFLNHHQKPLCDRFQQLLGNNFKFVSTMKMPSRFVESGYSDFSDVTYNLNAYESATAKKEAIMLGLTSDVVISGSAPELFLKKRFKANKLTFRYGERDFKKGEYQKFDLRRIVWYLYLHTRLRNRNVYMLCNSAFKPNDMKWVYAYPDKMFKWGYFPKVDSLDIEGILQEKRGVTVKLLYVSRLIKWKQPNLVITMADLLKKKGCEFTLDIIGSGSLEDEMKSQVSNLDLNDCVTFIGNMPNENVLQLMQSSNICIFASNRNEGWGAITNEAMANGCTIVASNEIGSAPYLIKNNVNGLVFESKNSQDLFEKVQKLIADRNLSETLARRAYQTILTNWSPENAAQRFIELSLGLLKGEQLKMDEGPCSKAEATPYDWYLKNKETI